MNANEMRESEQEAGESVQPKVRSRSIFGRRRLRVDETIHTLRIRSRTAREVSKAVREDAKDLAEVTATSAGMTLRSRDIARTILVAAGVVLGLYAIWFLGEIVLLAFLAILMATAIEPLVTYMRRGPFSRGSGALTVYASIIFVLGLIAYITVPSVISQGFSFVEGLPNRLETFRPQITQIQPAPVRDAALGMLDNALEALNAPRIARGDQLLSVGSTAISAVIAVVSVFVLAFYWLMERNAIKRVVLKLVGTRHAREVNLIWVEVEEKWGGWVRGQLVLMVAIGTMAGIGYVVLGLPNPLLLAGWAAATEIIPLIGPFVGFAPAVLVAFTMSPETALVLIVYALIIQQIEGYVLVPRVMSHAVGVTSLTVTLGIMIGSALDGIVGAFLAVPVAAAIQVLLGRLINNDSASQSSNYVIHAGRMIAPTDILKSPYESVGGPGSVMLSELRQFTVKDGRGSQARLIDIAVELSPESNPRITHLFFREGSKTPVELPWESLLAVDWVQRSLTIGGLGAGRAAPPAALVNYLLIERDIVGAKIIDLGKREVKKANDVFLGEENGHLYVHAVDISHWALIRKFGGFNLAKLGRHNLVVWKDVEFLRGSPGSVALGRLYNRHISRLTAQEIASIAKELPAPYVAETLTLLPGTLAVETLGAISPEDQTRIFAELKEDELLAVFATMTPLALSEFLARLSPELATRCREKLAEAEIDRKTDVRA